MTPRREEVAAGIVVLALLFVPTTASAAASFDDFGSPAILTGPTFGGSNAGATGEPDEPDHAGASLREGCTGPTSPDAGCLTSLWGRWTSGPAGEVTVETCGSGLNTTLAIYTGSSLKSLALLASNDDGGSPHTTCPQNPGASSVTYIVPASTTTIGAVAGRRAATGNIQGDLYYGPDTAIDSSPDERGTITTSSTTFGFSSTSSFASTFECSVDAGAFAPCTSPWASPGLSNGRHTFAVRATANGNPDINPARVDFGVHAPGVTGYRLGAKVFIAASRGTSSATAVGTTVSLRLSESAKARFTVLRDLLGRRAGSRCVSPNGSNRHKRLCRRTVTVGGFAVTGRAGANRFRFTGRLRGRRLAPGRYRLVLTARDAVGNASFPQTRRFRIVPR